MVVPWLPFSQKRSRSFYTIQSLVCPFIVSGGWWPPHLKRFWNWSHHWLGNGACFSSVTLWRASTGKAGHRGQGWILRPGCHSRASCIPLHSHVPLTQSCPPFSSRQVQAAAQAQKMLETAKMPGCLLCLGCQKKGWLLLSGEVPEKGKIAPPLPDTLCLASYGDREDRADTRTCSVPLSPHCSSSFVFIKQGNKSICTLHMAAGLG